MKRLILIMGLLSGLLGLFGCGKKEQNNISTADSVQTLNPNNILFTTPTLENTLPDFEDKTDTANLQFHEDDWRQIEFISKNQRNLIDQEIVKIKNIFDNHLHKGDTYIAFKNVAVRDLINQPLTIDFTLVKTFFADNNLTTRGLSLQNNAGQVKNGFTFTAHGVDYYGQLDDTGKVKWMGIYSAESNESLKASIPHLTKLLADLNLYLVDWRQMKVFDEQNIKTDFGKSEE
ncbi:MAG: hypothetical protein IM631_21120 [Cytophagales bacterium]|nr:hypothetical protein [Cytophagales bacterium]MCA6377896.1 hypothetical protein [Cytophagales bacterium]